jgi:hypothetical protein
MQLGRRGGIRAGVRRSGIAAAAGAAMPLGGATGAAARHYLNASVASPPLPGVTSVTAQPISTTSGVGTAAPTVLPDPVLLQVPFTKQTPLGNWAQHQESADRPDLG